MTNDNEKIMSIHKKLVDYINSEYIPTTDVARMTYNLTSEELESLLNLLIHKSTYDLLDNGHWNRYNEIFNYMIFLKSVKYFQERQTIK